MGGKRKLHGEVRCQVSVRLKNAAAAAAGKRKEFLIFLSRISGFRALANLRWLQRYLQSPGWDVLAADEGASQSAALFGEGMPPH